MLHFEVKSKKYPKSTPEVCCLSLFHGTESSATSERAREVRGVPDPLPGRACPSAARAGSLGVAHRTPAGAAARSCRRALHTSDCRPPARARVELRFRGPKPPESLAQNPLSEWSTQNHASRIKKAAAIYGWECLLLTFTCPGFDCDSPVQKCLTVLVVFGALGCVLKFMWRRNM